MIHVVDRLCEAGVRANEDRIFATEDAAVLLDGSTSLIRTRFDAHWFCDRFLELFREELASGTDLPRAVNQAVRLLYAEFIRQGGDGGGDYYPSASAVFVCQRGERLQMLSLGDCTALIFRRGAVEPQKIYDPSVEMLDQAVLDHAGELQRARGGDFSSFMTEPSVREHLLANRKRMNRPDGYRVLAFNMQPLTEADLLEFPLSEVEGITLYSDGFHLAEEKLLDRSAELAAVYAHLRALERSDPGFNRYPRFKMGDDASAMRLTFTLE